jgi:hypothetical protein
MSSSIAPWVDCNLLNSFYFSYNLDRCVLELYKQSLTCQSLNYYQVSQGSFTIGVSKKSVLLQ